MWKWRNNKENKRLKVKGGHIKKRGNYTRTLNIKFKNYSHLSYLIFFSLCSGYLCQSETNLGSRFYVLPAFSLIEFVSQETF